MNKKAHKDTPYGTKVSVKVISIRWFSNEPEIINFIGWFISPSVESPESLCVIEHPSSEVNYYEDGYLNRVEIYPYEDVVIGDWDDLY